MEKQKSITTYKKESIINVLNKYSNDKQLEIPKNYSLHNSLTSAFLILKDTKDKNGLPVLESCKHDSITTALLSMVTQGLNPIKKQCYFVAFGDELVMMRSYFGAQLAAKNIANVKDIVATIIWEGDEFKHCIDTESGCIKILKHEQELKNIGGNISGCYCTITKQDNSKYIELMPFSMIKKSWEKSKTKGGSDVHKKFEEEMSKRTVINRATKNIINSSSDQNILNYDLTEKSINNEDGENEDVINISNMEEVKVDVKKEF